VSAARYVGRLDSESIDYALYLGLKLDDPIGDSDGVFKVALCSAARGLPVRVFVCVCVSRPPLFFGGCRRLQGKRYFSCPEGHGYFCPVEDVLQVISTRVRVELGPLSGERCTAPLRCSLPPACAPAARQPPRQKRGVGPRGCPYALRCDVSTRPTPAVF
jgi:hypothetical protein